MRARHDLADELRLAAVAMRRHDEAPGDEIGRLRAEIPADEVQAEIEPRCGTGRDFVLLHVIGSPEAYARRHVPGAIHLPHRQISAERMAEWPEDTVFVAYCAGPHCNGADQAALKIARLGRPVKIMIGGITGWEDEGHPFATGSEPGSLLAIAAE